MRLIFFCSFTSMSPKRAGWYLILLFPSLYKKILIYFLEEGSLEVILYCSAESLGSVFLITFTRTVGRVWPFRACVYLHFLHAAVMYGLQLVQEKVLKYILLMDQFFSVNITFRPRILEEWIVFLYVLDWHLQNRAIRQSCPHGVHSNWAVLNSAVLQWISHIPEHFAVNSMLFAADSACTGPLGSSSSFWICTLQGKGSQSSLHNGSSTATISVLYINVLLENIRYSTLDIGIVY